MSAESTSAAVSDESKCPYTGATQKTAATTNQDWWPNQLNLALLNAASPSADPMDPDFDYVTEFESLNLKAVKKDLYALMTDSQEWWPADYGHYGPFFIRMAWHSAGTYRTYDGRGGAGAGMQRFAPLNSWPDNVNLDKARRLLWPIKQKYGKKISWADLMILAGNCALESMGFETFGFGGGRVDVWEPDDTYWGKEAEWLANNRYSGNRNLENPLAAVQMGLIYVNPEGPDGNPDILGSAQDIRETFARMAMNDEETVALIAGGHTFGKTHGAADPSKYVGAEPEAAPLQEMGLGWKNSFGSGNGAQTISSGLEGAWNATPTRWDNMYLQTLYAHEWEQTKSPAGATQWIPKNGEAAQTVVDAHDPRKKHAPIMFTTDLALRYDPIYGPISKRFMENFDEFADAFARAWFKLTHRDMGPIQNYLGDEVPAEDLIWQDPVPVPKNVIGAKQVAELKEILLKSSITAAELVETAWASASTYRQTDKRGGANGARIALQPQIGWQANKPAQLEKVLKALISIQKKFNKNNKKQVSLADLIVLGGVAAIEDAAARAGVKIKVPFTPGRTDATQEMTDVESFAVLEPKSDGFRNFSDKNSAHPAEFLLVDKAALLGVTAPEMVVLVAGLRTLGVSVNGTGILTKKPGVLSNDFFTNLLDINTVWAPTSSDPDLFEGRDRKSGKTKWSASRVDLVFGSNSQLRAICEVYASSDASKKFVTDFVNAWTKMMEA